MPPPDAKNYNARRKNDVAKYNYYQVLIPEKV